MAIDGDNGEKMPPYQRLPMAVFPDAGMWPVYQLSLRTGDLAGNEFPYYVETGDPAPKTVEALPSEIYSHELQKVDATDPVKVMSFCQRYGLVTSPAYPGERRLKEFRSRTPGVYNGDAHRWPASPADLCMNALNSPDSLAKELFPSLAGRNPVELSERARRLEADDHSIVGAISFAEVSQGIRALQVATVLPVAISYAASSAWSMERLLAYLSNKRFLSQSGPGYFLYSDDPIIRGRMLVTYEDRRVKDPAFRAMADSASDSGLDPEAIYWSELSQSLYQASSRSLDYLMQAMNVYSAVSNNWTGSPIGSSTASNPFSRIAERLHGTSERPRAPMGSLASAIIHQFSRTYTDPAPYRTCKNCGRIFKKYREEGYDKNIRETLFCRKSCTSSYNQKKARRSQSL